MDNLKMYLSQNDIDEIMIMVNESNKIRSYEFEAVFTSDHDYWKRDDFTRVLDECRKECCTSGNYKCIKEKDKTLDISVGRYRITIIGKYYIDLYIQNNEILSKIPKHSFTIIKKKFIKSHYLDIGLKLNLKDEIKIDIDDAEFAQALVEWERLGKTFRLKNRYSYLVDGIYSIDLTVVKAWKNGNQLARKKTLLDSKTLDAKETYEIELEYTPNFIIEKKERFDLKTWFKIVGKIKAKLDNSLRIVSKVNLEKVKLKYNTLFDKSNNNFERAKEQPASWLLYKYGLSPQVVSLNMDRLRTLKNMVENDYSITTKSDGIRMIGFICDNENNESELFIVASKSNNFVGTGCIFESEMKNTIFDGEFIDKDKLNNSLAHYLIFDCYFYKGNDIRQNKLLTGMNSRLSLAQQVLNRLKKTETLPNGFNFEVFVKEFELLNHQDFNSKCKVWLQKATDSIYDNDGLIFTPECSVGGDNLYDTKNNGDFVKSSGTFQKLLKWKDISMNSIDFKVEEENQIVEKIININGNDEIIKCQRCILKVLYSNSWKPTVEFTRTDYLNSNEKFESDANNVSVMEFMPYTPPDKNVCFAEFPIFDSKMRCFTSSGWTGPSFQNGDIVEMVYSFGNLKWIPIRVRKDKQNPNHFDVASNIWSLYFNPVTKEILKGEQEIPDKQLEDDAYYNQINVSNTAFTRKENKLNYFHCYIKGKILDLCLKSIDTKSKYLIDLACGKGGDLKRYINFGATNVIGIDNNIDNLHNPIDGAYRRLWKLNVTDKNKIIFLAGDVSKDLSLKNTFITPYDQSQELKLFRLKPEFDVATVFFALHYFFENPNKVEIFLDNIVKTVKVNGYFAGCCYDGSKVFDALKNKTYLTFNARKNEILRIEKKYKNNIKEFPVDNKSTGFKIRVLVQSIGVEHDEYLVNFEYLKNELMKRGFNEINSSSFESFYTDNVNSKYTMDYEEQNASFLNRIFVFKREHNKYSSETEKIKGNLKIKH